MRVRKQFDPDYNSNDYSLTILDESKTQQHMRDECNINKIISRYVKTGLVDHLNQNKAFYADLPNLDYREAYEKVFQAEEAFSSLPSELRNYLDNDPAQFVDWMQSGEDMEMKRKYKLVNEQAPEVPVKQTEMLQEPISND